MPFLGPLVAAVAGGLAGELWLGGGFWTVLLTALIAGFAVTLGYRLWKHAHHRREE
jgi:hypothetical protein